MKNYDYDPAAAKEARKKELSEITAKLEKGVKEVFTTGGYRKWLSFCSKLPKYSVNNQILIMLQKPDATMCQSYVAWQNVGRQVKKGEKGIRILAPSPFKIKQESPVIDGNGEPVIVDGERLTEKTEIMVQAFKPISIFDVSQTDGDPLPEFGVEELQGSVKDYDALFGAVRGAVPVPVSFERIDSEAKGFYHLTENRIVIAEGMSQQQNLKTLVHEAAHQALHSRDSRCGIKTKEQKEVEAESVAYVVCQHFGIDTASYSFGYVATWSRDAEASELRASLDLIRTTAASMIEAVEENLRKGEKIA